MEHEQQHTPNGNVFYLPGYDKAQSVSAREAMPDHPIRDPNPVNALARMLRLVRAEFVDVALLVLRIRELPELADCFGDELARQLDWQVSKRLYGCLRDSDQVLQLKHGEFAIILPQPKDPAHAEAVSQRLVDACSGQYQLNDVTTVVTAAIGIALCPTDTDDADELIRFTHLALHRAEAGNGSNVQYFSRDILSRHRRRLWMENELQQAMAEQRFTLHYQPQYDLDRHQVIGVEALVRLVTREGDLIPPDDFIGIAEDNGFIVELGQWVIREACRQLAEWRRTGCRLGHIAVNVSRRQLLDEQLVDVIEKAIVDNGLAYNDLELEITESCILKGIPLAGGILDTLHQQGVRIAVDDFGAGQSSFATLAQLPLDTFKLDRSFLASVADDNRARQVVKAIITMASQLGYRVVAEGIETTQQHHFLQSSGCHLAQGFGLGRPESAETIGSLLQLANVSLSDAGTCAH